MWDGNQTPHEFREAFKFALLILGGRFRAFGHGTLLEWSVAQLCLKVNSQSKNERLTTVFLFGFGDHMGKGPRAAKEPRDFRTLCESRDQDRRCSPLRNLGSDMKTP
jgi:hypothetical protein